MQEIRLLSENHNDYHLGFEVQSPEKQFISWDATYKEVIALPYVERDFDLSNETYEYYYFKYPVRMGNLLFPKFDIRIDNPQRKDIAVQQYYAQGEKGVPEFDFWQVHHQFEKHLLLNEHYEAYENLYSFFHKDGITFLVIYYGEPPHQYVFFNIINARKYPELITPIENEENIQLTDWVLFPKEYIGIETNYQENEIVKRRPSLLTERFGDQAVLWRDEVNKQLGVSVGEFCNIFPLSNIKKVDIDRMLPAKGGGADTLQVYYKKRKYPTPIFSTKEYDLDNYLPQLEKFFGRSIEVTGFYYNC
ncbi:hypothetical protein [Capnocytophaga stomatis]|uniref:hypothetical protein n=1 Tax=Capnocytophaga stomatis TaxID=1848904 RepID=UPI001ACED710|nr:hypothetical protein [Capnocytophaga stomatis]GIM49139.1 hypothetical protein CAPN003_05910 [Capnocytophaga stomatis]